MQAFGTHTIREIALASPAATRIFQEFRIDQRSMGNELFGEACRSAGVDPQLIESKLNDALSESASTGFDRISRSSLAEIVAYIIGKHHSYAKREAEQLTFLADKIAHHHGNEQPGLYEIRECLCEIFEEFGPHMMKEEIVLFPYIVELESKVAMGVERRKPHFGSIENPIRAMSTDHGRIALLFGKMRAASNDYQIPDDACAGVRSFFMRLAELEIDFYEHIRIEDDVLFPRSILIDEEAERLAKRAN